MHKYVLYTNVDMYQKSNVTELGSGYLPIGKPMLEKQVLRSRKVVYSHSSHQEDRGLMSQSPSSGKMGNSCLKAHLHLSVEAEVFIRRGMGTEQINQWKGLKSSLHADEYNPF